MKKLKYITAFAFILGLFAVSCNDDVVRPLGTGGDEDDDPIIIGGGENDDPEGDMVNLDSLNVN